jgi:hypothetical protein
MRDSLGGKKLLTAENAENSTESAELGFSANSALFSATSAVKGFLLRSLVGQECPTHTAFAGLRL